MAIEIKFGKSHYFTIKDRTVTWLNGYMVLRLEKVFI